MPAVGGDGEILVTGRARFVADVDAGDCVEACLVRATLPHATIESIDLGTRHGVSGRDLGLRPIELEVGGMATMAWHPIPTDRVRYVGEPVAIVWAANRYDAEDLAERVSVRYRPLEPGTPIHDAAPDNLLFTRTFDSGGVDDAMAQADVVLERTFSGARQSAAPIEGRGVVADHDPATGVTTLWTSTQLPHLVRRGVAWALGVEQSAVRVRVPHVGGGFGLKANLYAEEIALAAVARRLGRPVRWIEDRTENLLAGTHAHDTHVTLRVGVTGDGRILAVEADVVGDMGAYSVWPATAVPEPGIAAASVFAPYAFGALRFTATAIVSNRSPVGPCRGIGQNAAVFATERMMDIVAAELGIDPLELRRRNVLRDLPCTTPAGRMLDSGDYVGLLERLEEASAYGDLRRQQAAARAEGRMLGIGLSLFNEVSGSGATDYRRRGVTTLPGVDATRVVVTDEGRVEIYTSAADAGQGHADTYRALAKAELGVPAEQIDVIEGDTERCPEGSGTFISRGAVGVVDSLVEALRMAAKEDLAPGTEVTHVHEPSQVYPCGAHLALVEVDPVGLVSRVLRYVVVEDCGRILHRDVVDGRCGAAWRWESARSCSRGTSTPTTDGS